MGFPWRIYKTRQIWDDFRRLVRDTNERSDGVIRVKRSGRVCSDAFFQEERCNTPRQGRSSAVEVYSRKSEVLDAFLATARGDKRRSLISKLCGWAAPAQFHPAVAGALCRRLGVRHVLDPFAGWGDRCVAALAVGCAYTGIDSNERLAPPPMLACWPSLAPAMCP